MNAGLYIQEHISNVTFTYKNILLVLNLTRKAYAKIFVKKTGLKP